MKITLTKAMKEFKGTEVYQIKALKDAEIHGTKIKAGELGGFVSKDTKLINGWVKEGSVVTNSKIVASVVRGDSHITKSKIIKSVVVDSNLVNCEIERSTIGYVDIGFARIKGGILCNK